MPLDPRVARLRIHSADEKIFSLRRDMDATEAKLQALRQGLREALEERVAAMAELASHEVYI